MVVLLISDRRSGFGSAQPTGFSLTWRRNTIAERSRSEYQTQRLTMPYMYILECCDGSFYTGGTKNLPRRLWQHQNGVGANHTSKRLSVELVYAEKFERVSDAFYREKQVQGWSRSKKIALMESDWDRLHILAECRNESRHNPTPIDEG